MKTQPPLSPVSRLRPLRRPCTQPAPLGGGTLPPRAPVSGAGAPQKPFPGRGRPPRGGHRGGPCALGGGRSAHPSCAHSHSHAAPHAPQHILPHIHTLSYTPTHAPHTAPHTHTPRPVHKRLTTHIPHTHYKPSHIHIYTRYTGCTTTPYTPKQSHTHTTHAHIQHTHTGRGKGATKDPGPFLAVPLGHILSQLMFAATSRAISSSLRKRKPKLRKSE